MPQKGGYIKRAKAAAKVNIAKKSALIAIDSPNSIVTPKAFKAETIDEAVSGLNVSFKVNLKKMDGTSSREKIDIQALDDFEEPHLVQKSEALKEQERQMTFLHDFQEKLDDDAFLEELKELLESEKKEKLLKFLKGWSAQLKKPQSGFLDLLRSGL